MKPLFSMKHKNYTLKIPFPENVEIKKYKDILIFHGPLGSTGLNLQKIDPLGLSAFSLHIDEKYLCMMTQSKAFQGLFKKLILNKIQGITRGFLVYLKIVGIGYRASLQKNTLFLKVGYSHDLLYNIPKSLKIFLVDPTLLCLFGIDKNQVTQVARKLRDLRKPSPYKGKGIRLLNEILQSKTGKRK